MRTRTIYNWSLCLTVYKYCLLIQLTQQDARHQNNISLLEETLDCAKGLRRRSNLRYTSTVTPWSANIPTTHLCDTADCTFQCCVNYLSIYISRNICFSKAQQPLVGQDFLVIEASWWHSDTPHSIGLFWTSDEPDAEILCDDTQHSQEIDFHAPPAGFELAIPAFERKQTHAVDRTATETCNSMSLLNLGFLAVVCYFVSLK